MAFFGKKWQKSDFENILELMDKLEVPEKTRAMLRQTESVSSFVKNADGTVQYIVTLGDKEVLSQKITLGTEQDFTTPDGISTKITFTLNGEILKSVMKFPNGRVVNMDREFGADKMVLKVWVDGVEPKASVTYLAV